MGCPVGRERRGTEVPNLHAPHGRYPSADLAQQGLRLGDDGFCSGPLHRHGLDLASVEGSDDLLEVSLLRSEACLVDHVRRGGLGIRGREVAQGGVAFPDGGVTLGGQAGDRGVLALDLSRRTVVLDLDADRVRGVGKEAQSCVLLTVRVTGVRHDRVPGILQRIRRSRRGSGSESLGRLATALGIDTCRERHEGILVVDDLRDRLEAGDHDLVVESGVTLKNGDASGDFVAEVIDLSGHLCLASGCAECCHDVLLGDSCCVGCI